MLLIKIVHFATNYTYRFPRFKRLRDDKNPVPENIFKLSG